MEAIILIGIQAVGKSTFYKHNFFKTHVRVNLDMLKTRHREKLLLNACIEMKQAFVVDNTNPTKADRKRYIDLAKANNFQITGYYLSSRVSEAIKRNNYRKGKEKIPERGIIATFSKLQRPDYSEGFNKLFHVKITPDSDFKITPWRI
ncbi:MAG: AAA family ATPase [Desulfobacteraceae bacterium]|jgi:predicted kinase